MTDVQANHQADFQANYQTDSNKYQTAYIGIGSNLGDRKENCNQAIKLMAQYDIIVKDASTMIDTPAWGLERQPNFINLCVKVLTRLTPHKLLAALQEIEDRLGRVKNERWGPRIIDLDILLYGDIVLIENDLRIPHALLHRRDFALRTIDEIAPDAWHPALNRSIKTLLTQVRDIRD
jgi:2-amino-4-hydroxy-6-hydroxymethyldihydropteridine diphosphokinase